MELVRSSISLYQSDWEKIQQAAQAVGQHTQSAGVRALIAENRRLEKEIERLRDLLFSRHTQEEQDAPDAGASPQ